MPINHYDLQRLAAIKIKEDIRKKGFAGPFWQRFFGQPGSPQRQITGRTPDPEKKIEAGDNDK